jgi:hypothetical protein
MKKYSLPSSIKKNKNGQIVRRVKSAITGKVKTRIILGRKRK